MCVILRMTVQKYNYLEYIRLIIVIFTSLNGSKRMIIRRKIQNNATSHPNFHLFARDTVMCVIDGFHG